MVCVVFNFIVSTSKFLSCVCQIYEFYMYNGFAAIALEQVMELV